MVSKTFAFFKINVGNISSLCRPPVFRPLIFSCIHDEKDNSIDHSDDESVEILDEWLNRKKNRQKSPLGSPRLHKKVKSEPENITKKTSSFNWPKAPKTKEVAAKFISTNPFFTILIKPFHLVESKLSVPNLKGVIENKEKYMMLQIGKRSWNVKLLSYYKDQNMHCLSAGWSLFASESGLKPGDACL